MVSQRTLIGREVASGKPTLGDGRRDVNIGRLERWASLLGGAALVSYGLKKRNFAALALAAFGGELLYRGLTGECQLYKALGIKTAEKHGRVTSVAAGKGVKVVQTVTIDRPPDELYRVWRNFDQLPRFMTHLVDVRSEGNRSRWTAKAPAGRRVEWDAEVINEEPNRLIAWRSVEGSEVSTAGSVTFTPISGGRSTEVRVTLKYDPPAGKLGSWVAWLFGEEPSLQVRDDLKHFKRLMERGVMAHVAAPATV